MSYHAYTALYLTYGATNQTLSPDPLVLRLSLTAPALVYDQVAAPDPLILRLSLTDPMVVAEGEDQTLTPDPLVLRLSLTTPAVAFDQALAPDPLVLRFALQDPVLVPGPVTLTPDPLQLRLFMARAKVCEPVGDEAVLIATQYVVSLYSPSLGELTLPSQAIQGNARNVGAFEDWSASIPSAAQYLDQIVDYAADAESELIIKQKLTYLDGSACWDTVGRAPLTGWDRNRGSTKYVITLRGRVEGVEGPDTIHALTGLIQENTTVNETESNSVRVPVDLTIRPGDTVTYGGYLSFVVDRIAYTLSANSRYMTLTSA